MVVEATRAQGEALARELIPQIERLLATVTDPVVLAKLQAALDKVRQMQAEGREKTAFDGLSQAVRDYAAKAADAFGNTREAATRAFQGIEDALTDLVVKGKADFRSLVVSILAALVALKPGAGGNGIGLAAANSIYPERIAENRTILLMAIAASLVSLAILLLSPRWSFRPET